MELIIEIVKLVTALLGLAGAAVALVSNAQGDDLRQKEKAVGGNLRPSLSKQRRCPTPIMGSRWVIF